MADPTFTRRTTLAGLMGGAATLTAAIAAPRRAWAASEPAASASDGTLTIDFGSAMHWRLSRDGEALTDLEPGEGVRLADGKVIDRFVMIDHDQSALAGGKRHSLRG